MNLFGYIISFHTLFVYSPAIFGCIGLHFCHTQAHLNAFKGGLKEIAAYVGRNFGNGQK